MTHPSQKTPAPIAILSAAKPKPKRRINAVPSDFDLADVFAGRHANHVRYDATAKRWLVFDDVIWRPDQTGKVPAMMRRNLELFGIGSMKKLREALHAAKLDTRLVTTRETWDTDPYLLGTPTEIINLRTGNSVPAKASLHVTMSTAVTPDNAPANVWLQFLDQAMKKDVEMVRYLQQVAGYCLTGLVNHELFWFGYGDGGGGKGTFIDTICAAMGDYAWKANNRTLMKGERHLTELAAFESKRLVYFSETSQGQEWDMARLKELTGGDPINANRMRQDPFTFLPTHKLFGIGNHAPRMQVVDNSVKRRLRILPFDNILPDAQRDPDLKLKLKAELAQILAWAIAGAADVLENGFSDPAAVRSANESFIGDNDTFGEWLSEKCTRGPRHEDRSSLLLKAWNSYREDLGDGQERAPAFNERMKRAGFEKFKKSDVYWRGLTLKSSGGA
jgi:putative DNA primase/helicase